MTLFWLPPQFYDGIGTRMLHQDLARIKVTLARDVENRRTQVLQDFQFRYTTSFTNPAQIAAMIDTNMWRYGASEVFVYAVFI